jgi:hypothetical protein
LAAAGDFWIGSRRGCRPRPLGISSRHLPAAAAGAAAIARTAQFGLCAGAGEGLDRLPVSQGPDGRDHNRHAFSLWLAGGGFKSGSVHSASDDFGYQAVADKVRVIDLQATLLYALGLDHERLVYLHAGREDSLTDAAVTGARILHRLLA